VGFRVPWADGEDMLKSFPACAFFTLADVLHELGRPVIFTGPGGVRVASPIKRLEMVYPDEWSDPRGDQDARNRSNRLCRTKGLLSKDEAERVAKAPRIELFWVVDEEAGQDGLGHGSGQRPNPPVPPSRRPLDADPLIG
jgi:hypothetical protein